LYRAEGAWSTQISKNAVGAMIGLAVANAGNDDEDQKSLVNNYENSQPQQQQQKQVVPLINK
jgi:hypothetical protein